MAKLTIVGAMKLRKRLAEKVADLEQKIAHNHAHLENTEPMYKEQEKVISSWIQARHDCIRTMGDLSIAIQKTNLQTNVEIVLGGKSITKSIAQWVLRRRELAPLDLRAYAVLNDRGLREVPVQDPSDKTKVNVIKVKRYYDPATRDKMIDLFTHEPSRIDAALETANATTEIVDDINFDEDGLVQK
jgi:hypothetical protein